MVTIYNPKSGLMKRMKYGWSWLYLFFGGWALIFTGQWAYILIELGLNALCYKGVLRWSFIGGYHTFLFFFGNKLHVKHLVKKGWRPATAMDATRIGMTWVPQDKPRENVETLNPAVVISEKE